jgi:molecular chaperone DnaJ
MDAVKGIEKTIVHQGKEHSVKIPAGVDDGTRIRFNDFDVTVDVLPDSKFKRDGYDVFVDHNISFPLAAIGGNTDIPTIDGNLTIKVRAGTQSGTMIRLRGKGIPHVRSHGQGDEYIRLLVEVPKNLTREQRRILEELQKTL